MPKKTSKKTSTKSGDEVDALGFRKKNYPLLVIMAVIVGNVLAFDSNNSLYAIGVIILDVLMVWWGFKWFKNKIQQKRGG